MADRCEYCYNRVGDGVTPHADDCPMRAPELLDEVGQLKRDIDNLNDQCDLYENTLRHILSVLGPTPGCGAMRCEGCKDEIQEALDLIKRALGDEKAD